MLGGRGVGDEAKVRRKGESFDQVPKAPILLPTAAAISIFPD